MKSKTEFICEVCGEVYSTPEGALECESRHSLCDCEKYGSATQTYVVIGYGKAIESVMDFRNKELRVFLSDDGSETRLKKVPIRFCPFCGREL